MLRQQFHNYEIVENGQDAVNITADKEFDLILMVRILDSDQVMDSLQTSSRS